MSLLNFKQKWPSSIHKSFTSSSAQIKVNKFGGTRNSITPIILDHNYLMFKDFSPQLSEVTP